MLTDHAVSLDVIDKLVDPQDKIVASDLRFRIGTSHLVDDPDYGALVDLKEGEAAHQNGLDDLHAISYRHSTFEDDAEHLDGFQFLTENWFGSGNKSIFLNECLFKNMKEVGSIHKGDCLLELFHRLYLTLLHECLHIGFTGSARVREREDQRIATCH